MNVNQYARLKRRALRPLQKLLRALIHTFGVPVGDGQVEEFSGRLWRPVSQARERNYRVSLKYLDTVDLPSGLVIPKIRDYPLEVVTNTVRTVTESIVVNGDPVTRVNRHDPVVVQTVQKAIEGPISRQALDPARETITDIGSDEGQEHVGWARVLVGARSCAFCAMLASRGPVYTSYETAKGRGGNPLDTYHPYITKSGKVSGGVCDCEAVLVTDFKWEGRAAWERLEDLWLDTGAKASGAAAARKRFRAEWDKQVKAGETGKYLVESVQPKD